MTKYRIKVLIVAYACEPNKTSEPGVGWNFVNEISKFADVTVLTRQNNKSNILSSKINNTTFLYFDLPSFLTQVKKKIPLGIPIYYFFWLKGAYKYIIKNEILRKQKFDLVHHLTFGTTKNIPSIKKIHIPFIWGPIGGGDYIPFRFLIRMNLKTIINEIIYFSFNFTSLNSKKIKYAQKFSSAIIFRTNSTSFKFPQFLSHKYHLISETAINSSLIKCDYSKNHSPELIILCVGRLLHSKGYLYALKGFNNYLKSGGKGKLIFYGAGADENYFKKYVKKNKLQSDIEFMGFRPNHEIKQAMQKSHVLLHPSFREGGSWSILEAMSCGLPVICLDTSGPKDMVTKTSGFLITIKTPSQVSKDISKALMTLSSDENLFKMMSKNAILRTKNEYSWKKRGKQIKEVYNQVIDMNYNAKRKK